MKVRSLAIFAISTVAITGFTLDDAKLTRSFSVGSKDVYTQTFKSKNSIESPVGNQDFNITGSSDYAIVYKAVKGEACEVELVTSNMKIESDNEMAGGMTDQMPKEVTVSGLLDGRNRISDIKSAKSGDPMMAMMLSSSTMGSSGFFTEFPDKAVKVGDTWEFPLGLAAPGTPKDTKLKAKLDGDEGKHWVVHVTGVIPMKIDSEEMAKASGQAAQMEMVMTMTMTMDYKVNIEKGTGRTLSMKGTIGSDMKLELPSMGMSMPGKGSVEMSAELKK